MYFCIFFVYFPFGDPLILGKGANQAQDQARSGPGPGQVQVHLQLQRHAAALPGPDPDSGSGPDPGHPPSPPFKQMATQTKVFINSHIFMLEPLQLDSGRF